MKPITFIHSSSRFDRSPATLSRAMDSYTAKAAVVTLTEVGDDQRVKAAIKNGFRLLNTDYGGWDDCAISVNKARFDVVHHEGYKLPMSNQGETGKFTSRAQIAVLEDKDTGQFFVVSVAHFPAHLEGDMARGRKTERTVAWLLNTQALRRRVNELKRKYKCDGALIVADWNLNFKKPWVRALFKAKFPYWKCSWRAPYPKDGTHNARIIDATLYKGNIRVFEEARLLPDDDSSDHRPYINSFRFS